MFLQQANIGSSITIVILSSLFLFMPFFLSPHYFSPRVWNIGEGEQRVDGVADKTLGHTKMKCSNANTIGLSAWPISRPDLFFRVKCCHLLDRGQNIRLLTIVRGKLGCIVCKGITDQLDFFSQFGWFFDKTWHYFSGLFAFSLNWNSVFII